MVTKITKKSLLNSGFFDFFLIDSLKILIETSKFKQVSIPQDFILLSGDEVISEFKKKSFEIFISGKTVRIGKQRKILRNTVYEDVIIMFSAKLNPDNYFSGIDRKTVEFVLNEIKNRGFVDFDDIDEVIREIRIVDVDITYNQPFDYSQEKIVNFLRRIKEYVLPQHKARVSLYNRKDNTGIEFGLRHKTQYYLKIYLKSKEILPYINEVNLTDEQREYILQGNTLIRYEFTIRNKREFKSFLGISNRLVELWEIIADKEKMLNLLRKYFNHYVDMKKVKKDFNKDILSSLNINDEIILTSIAMLKAAGYTDGEIYHTLINDTVRERLRGVDIQTNAERKRKERRKKKVEKYLEIISLNTKEVQDIERELKEIREAFSLLFEK